MAKFHEKEVKYQIDGKEVVDSSVLEPIDYLYAFKRGIEIKIDHPEFTSVCPMTGLPDFGCITIKYRPNKKIVELKSLKFYLLQYRNVGIFYEHVVNMILDDLSQKLKPEWMEVTGDFTSRGGLTTKVIAVYRGEDEKK